MTDPWGDAAKYEAYIGRWSRRLAPAFLRWASLPRDARVLDLGSGSGALSAACLAAGAREVRGIDASPGYVAHAQAAFGKDGRAAFEVADAQALPFPDATFDAAVSGLVLNFLPDPARGAAQMRRVTRPGGLVAAYVWDYADGMEIVRHFWDAAVALDPQGAGPKAEAARFALCTREAMAALFRDAGLQGVVADAVEVKAEFRDFDDYWQPFLGGQGPAGSYAVGLPEPERARLRAALRSRLPVQRDGTLALRARAWAAKGRVP